LRLWSARATENFDFEYFKSGDYEQAVYKKIYSENISKVLYPNDDISQGKELRLKQEYFFTAASIADIIRRYKVENSDLRKLHEKVVIQLNDTHPTLAIPELMRVLIDDHGMPWKAAWEVVRKTFAYTNHTLMPEALECWPVPLLEKLLPRHLQIIYEINADFLKEIEQKFPGDKSMLSRLSIIEEGDPKKIRMAFLAMVGSFSVNGVSKLHSELLKTRVLTDFYTICPEKFNNKTNGITQRRWLLKANPGLADLINQSIGDRWTKKLEHLEKLAPLANDERFRDRWQNVKNKNKIFLAEHITKTTGVPINPESMFDVQVKRIHEYKRQLLFGFYIIAEYLQLRNNPKAHIFPRTYILGGKAAPGYHTAKLIIKFLNNVADVINTDQSIHDQIKMVFLENYRVSLAERIFPASDLSEQISTAGTEASGTGNMKFMLNGALTIGTLDGANIEMFDSVGKDNIFIFGHKTEEIEQLKRDGYNPQKFIHQSPVLEEVVSAIKNGMFSAKEQGIFTPLIENAFYKDPFQICADFDSYFATQQTISQLYKNNPEDWTKKSIINVAKTGIFSSDRTIKEYAREIWNVPVSEG
jgi:starch phosphorylase